MSERKMIGILRRLDLIFVWPVLLWRWCQFGYTYRRIYLGQGEYTIVEPEDYYTFSKYNWIFIRCNKKPYAISEFKIGRMKTKRMYLHRAIMHARKGKLIDHRNGYGLDNRRDNLRPATHSQNMCNRRKTKLKTTSRFIGVHFCKETNKWRAAIKCKGKIIALGRFVNEVEAAKAYDAAAKKYHGEFASLNFPPEKRAERQRGIKNKLALVISRLNNLCCAMAKPGAGPAKDMQGRAGEKAV